ncbi:hypothetical protein EJB05_42402, partial [Eragrostis curvula]
MEHDGGAAKCSKHSSGDDDFVGEDRLSALPDDVLILILLHLDTKNAVRTSILSRRWRHMWTLLPELKFRFNVAPEPYRFRDALATGDVPLHNLFVKYKDDSPESFTVWLPAAARRVSGNLTLHNSAIRRNANGKEVAVQGGVIELHCFEKATVIVLHLGLLRLAMPPAGVFARLTHLTLNGIQFHGPCNLRDAISSQRCPCLKRLGISNTRGLDSLTVDCKSLLELSLNELVGLRLLTIVAPALTELTVALCFVRALPSEQVANISAPQLQLLEWEDLYDQRFIQLGNMALLRRLSGLKLFVYGHHDFGLNRACLGLLKRFKAIESLMITLLYDPEIGGYQYLMDDMTVLPNFNFLDLVVIAYGHAFGASSFHVLRMCTSIRRMVLTFSAPRNFKVNIYFLICCLCQAPIPCSSACLSGCICDQSPNWKTEELLLNCLQELEIKEFRGSEHEFAFIKRLFGWATALKQVTVNFSHRITGSESKIKEFFHMFQSFSRSGIYMKFCFYKNFREVSFNSQDDRVSL